MWQIPTAEALKAFASRLAPFIARKDMIALNGDLGAGKTTFTQGLVKALGIADDVTSPTYQLVHSYASPRGPIYHCDFYRLPEDELEETGFRDLAETGVVILEWPEKVGAHLPDSRLDVHITEEGEGRSLILKGHGTWAEKLARFSEIDIFLQKHGWGEAACLTVIGDASTRAFSRLKRGAETIMLMDWPPQPDGPPMKDGLPYSSIAHLATEGRPYLALAHWLKETAGLSAPHVIASDEKRGFYLIEDLGEDVFGALLKQGQSQQALYSLALDGLIAIAKAAPPQTLPWPGSASPYRLPDYDRGALEIELELILAWYFKRAHGKKCPESLTQSFFAAWKPYIDWLLEQPRGLVLRDYHSPNLLVCMGREGPRRLGVIDFQDAMWGNPAYDVVSLCQDARVDVPHHTEGGLLDYYCQNAASNLPTFDEAAFRKAYAILGAQRNTKILGIFARLSMRDGKHDYLAHMPRVTGYLQRNLAHDALKPLQEWYNTHLFSDAAKA